MTVYAVADKVPEGRAGLLTSGKPYEVTAHLTDDRAFWITGDVGNRHFCLWEGCAYLDGGNWRRVER